MLHVKHLLMDSATAQKRSALRENKSPSWRSKSARGAAALKIAGRTGAKRASARVEQPSGLLDPTLYARAGAP